MGIDQETVERVREFNRFYTDILGLINQHILQSGFSLTEARILYELSTQGSVTANQLAARLKIDKSYMSRILAKFARDELITKKTSEEDNRALLLELTTKGNDMTAELTERSNLQVKTLLAPLLESERSELISAFAQTQSLLTQSARRFRIRAFENSARDAAFITDQQLEIYEREYGFTSEQWKTYLTQGVDQMLKQFDQERDCIYLLEKDNALCGCIAIAHVTNDTAQLRFFFVDPRLRGFGAGDLLIEYALAFCKEKRYRNVFLWTCSHLASARHLYQKHGFQPTQTHPNDEWGAPVTEERWELDL